MLHISTMIMEMRTDKMRPFCKDEKEQRSHAKSKQHCSHWSLCNHRRNPLLFQCYRCSNCWCLFENVSFFLGGISNIK